MRYNDLNLNGGVVYMIEVLKGWYKNLLSDPNSATFFILMVLFCLIIAFFADVLSPLLIALGVSYILEVPVKYLERKKIIGRKMSASVLMSLFFIFIFFLVVNVVPSLMSQMKGLSDNIPELINRMNAYLGSKAVEYPYMKEHLESLGPLISEKISDYCSSFLQNDFVFLLKNITSFLAYIVIIPILSFLMITDKESIIKAIKSIFPSNLDTSKKMWGEMNNQLMNYVSGKFMHVVIMSIINYVVFLCFDLNYALLLGLSVGLSVIVPYVGAVIVAVPVVGVALYQFGLSGTFGFLALAFLVVQVLDGNVVVPMLFSKHLKLSPFVILSSVLVFGSLWGFWGVFFSIPLATFIKTIITNWPKANQSKADVIDVQAENARLKEEITKLNGELRLSKVGKSRIESELAMMKSKAESEKIQTMDSAKRDMAEDIFPAIESLMDASSKTSAKDKRGDKNQFAEIGAQLVEKMVACGLEIINATGCILNSDIHHVVKTVDKSGDLGPGVVSKVLKPGYRFNGKVLRQADVEVTQAKENAEK